MQFQNVIAVALAASFASAAVLPRGGGSGGNGGNGDDGDSCSNQANGNKNTAFCCNNGIISVLTCTLAVGNCDAGTKQVCCSVDQVGLVNVNVCGPIVTV